MKTSTILLLSILATCSVWVVHGNISEVNSAETEQVDRDVSVEAPKIPGLCWVCKRALNKLKKKVGNKGSTEKLKAKLNSFCNKIKPLKAACFKFVKKRVGKLLNQLQNNDSLTICINMKACKRKDLLFYPHH